MPIYIYRAKKGPKDIIEDKIEAQSEKEAVEKINQMGYMPVRIQVSTAGAAEGIFTYRPQARVKPKEITIFTRQLASLLKSGVPILVALNIFREQTVNQRLNEILVNIYNMIKEGESFSSALSRYPNAFPQLYIAMIKAGEDSGTLAEALLRISEYRSKEEEVFSKLRMALAYPILMAIVGLLTIIFMLTFVIPRLASIFVSLGQELPLPTQILISTSKFLRQWWVWGIIFLLILAIRQQLRMKAARLPLSKLKLRIPIFGQFIQKNELARFCRTLELLIRNGIPILRAMNIAIPVLDNEAIKIQLAKSYKELEQGGSFGKSLKGSMLFPAFMSNLISVGEESGRLDEALSEIAGSYERDTDEAMKIFSSLLEPITILVMGLIVGFIVIAMLLPVFQINFMAR